MLKLKTPIVGSFFILYLCSNNFKNNNMNEYDVKRLALILAVQAEIEGMKSENTYREINNHDLTYGEGDFQNKATEFKELAYKHNEQL